MNAIAEVQSAEAAIQARCDMSEVAKVVRCILGRYNQKPQGDADIYVRQMTALLANYPAEVVRAFANPATDPLPESDFMPSVPVVRKAANELESEMWRRHQRAEERARRSQPRTLAPPEPEPEYVDPEYVKRRVAELKAALVVKPMDPEIEKRKAEFFRRTRCAPGEAAAQSDLVRNFEQALMGKDR